MLCFLVTPVLRSNLLPYYQQVVIVTSEQNKNYYYVALRHMQMIDSKDEKVYFEEVRKALRGTLLRIHERVVIPNQGILI